MASRLSAAIVSVRAMPRGQRMVHEKQLVQSQKVRLFSAASRSPSCTSRHSWRGV